MSGTFYHSPAPGELPFVKVGDRVTKGQTIGIIEAMKLMNEIEVGITCCSLLLQGSKEVAQFWHCRYLWRTHYSKICYALLQADSAGTIVEFTAPNGTSVAPGQVSELFVSLPWSRTEPFAAVEKGICGVDEI